ncbi:unnamed protein product [Effrenium voratum]|uniref:Uncharacterized protein n=1 Tax=Effrenium voratum TaxID=2562239 RepID=A0AA36IWK3_9DINO|nr:unnamed protein product [Effrenium voratum]
MEAISVRDAGLQLNKKAEQYQRPLDVVRFLQDEFGKNDVKLSRFEDLKMNIADKVVRKHDNEVPVLRDASDEVVKTYKVVIKFAFAGLEETELCQDISQEESFEKESEEEIMEVEGTSEGQEVFVPKPADVREGEPFEVNCGGLDMKVSIPKDAVDENTGIDMDPEQLKEAFGTEMTRIVTWCGHMIKAFSRKQTVPALSSCEAELIAAVDLAKEALSVKFEKYELKTRYNLLVDSINRAILLGD